MVQFLLCATFLAGSATDHPLTYTDAHRLATRENRPMLILVSAQWCPACRVMKQDTLAEMRREGKLKDVVFAVVDVDEEPELSTQLMRSTTIPQLVLYTPAPTGWYRMYLHGAQEAEKVSGMIARGLELQRRDRALAKQPQDEKSDSASSVADE